MTPSAFSDSTIVLTGVSCNLLSKSTFIALTWISSSTVMISVVSIISVIEEDDEDVCDFDVDVIGCDGLDGDNCSCPKRELPP